MTTLDEILKMQLKVMMAKWLSGDDATLIPAVAVGTMPANVSATGTIDATTESVVATLPNGCASVAVQITGTWVGQLDFQGSVDGTNYQSVEASNGTASVNATASNDIFVLPGAGYVKIRVYGTLITSGAAVVTMNASIGVAASIQTGSLPAGGNWLGKVGMSAFSIPITLTVTNDVYTVGDVVGGLITLPAAVRAVGGISRIDTITLAGVSALAYELWFFNADIATPAADNAAFTLVAADELKCLGSVPIPAANYTAAASAFNVATVYPVSLLVKAAAASTSIYAYLKATAVTTPGTTTLYLNVKGRYLD